MPNWLKHTLHIVAIAAGVVISLPTMGLALPAWALTAAGVAGLVAAKASPGADKPEAK